MLSLAWVVLTAAHSVAAAGDQSAIPEVMARCLAAEPLKDVVNVPRTINPFYLRGDFDGDGKPDYAFEGSLVQKRQAVVVVCLGNGTSSVLGGTYKFSDRENDHYFGTAWMVCNSSEIRTMIRPSDRVPRNLGSRRESILMLWDDLAGLIYWDGRKFRWVILYSLDGS